MRKDVGKVIEELGFDKSSPELVSTIIKHKLIITDEMREVIVALKNAGCSQNSIASYFNLSNGKVSNIIRDYNAKLEFNNGVLIDKGKIFALYRARWPISEIALDCSISEQVVYDVLTKKG